MAKSSAEQRVGEYPQSPVKKAPLEQESLGLLSELKQLRLKIARERSVPAFVVFSDKTLIQMANDAPQTESEFLAINGVGKKKMDEFFDRFSEVIRSYNTIT